MGLFRTVVFTCLTLLSLQVQASWVLDKENSHLYFTFTKSTHLSTTATFTDIDGRIDDDRTASLTINLASLNSGLDKRDGRLRDLFFEVAKYPKAEVSMKVFNRLVRQVEAADEAVLNLGFYLTLNGERKRMKADVLVSKNDRNEIELQTLKPIIVMASEFGLSDKVDLLVKIAGVNNISHAVPVTFRLKFVPVDKQETIQK